MEARALELAATALGIMLDPSRLMALAAGVLVGLTIGVIPGLAFTSTKWSTHCPKVVMDCRRRTQCLG